MRASLSLRCQDMDTASGIEIEGSNSEREAAFMVEIQGTQPMDYSTMFVDADAGGQRRFCVDINNTRRNKIDLADVSVAYASQPSFDVSLSDLVDSPSFPISKMVVAQHALTPLITRVVFHLRHEVVPVTEAVADRLTVKIPVPECSTQEWISAPAGRSLQDKEEIQKQDKEESQNIEQPVLPVLSAETSVKKESLIQDRPAIVDKITPIYLPKTTKLEIVSDRQLKIKQVRLSKSGVLRIEVFNATTSLPNSISINNGILRSVSFENEAGELRIFINLTEPVIYEVESVKGEFFGVVVTFQNPLLEQLISLNVNEETISKVLLMLFTQYGANIVAGSDVTGKVTARLVDVPLKAALDEILKAEGYGYIEENGLIRVMKTTDIEERKAKDASATELAKAPLEIESKLFELKYAKVVEMQQLLQRIVGTECSVLPDQRTNSIILVSSTDSLRFQEHSRKVEELIRQLDKEVSDEGQSSEAKIPAYAGAVQAEAAVVEIVKKVFKLSYADPENAKAILDPLLSDKGTIEAIVAKKKEESKSGSGGVGTGGSMTGGRVAAGEGIQLEEAVGQGGYIVVSDIKEVVDTIEKEIAKLDAPVPQVEIKAMILEDTSSGDNELGIDWTAISKDDQISLSFSRDGGMLTKGIIPAEKFTGILNFISNNSNLKIKSNPSITTLEGQPAVFHSGDKIPYSKVFIQEGIEQVDTVFEEVGIVLAATPYMKENGMISLVLSTSVSSEGGFTPSGQPRISTRSTRSQVLIKSGDTLVIAGLVSGKTSTVISKVPILGDIPLIGRVFSTASEVEQENRVTIFITPSIVVNVPEGVSP